MSCGKTSPSTHTRKSTVNAAAIFLNLNALLLGPERHPKLQGPLAIIHAVGLVDRSAQGLAVLSTTGHRWLPPRVTRKTLLHVRQTA